jgi:hypothetical protein
LGKTVKALEPLRESIGKFYKSEVCMAISAVCKEKHSVSLVMVTPDMARMWLSGRPYKGQRPLRPYHVKFLAEEMRRGHFRPTAEVAFAVEDGRHYLVNGNHTLHAIALCEIPQLVIVMEYQSQGEEDTAFTYGAIDTNVSRTINDLFSAINLKDEVAFTATQLNFVGAAVKFINSKFRHRPIGLERTHYDDYLRLIREYAPSAHEYIDMVAGLPQEVSKPCFRAATLSVALVTIRFSAQVLGRDRVSDFWKGVAFDDGIQSNDPRKAVHRHLLTVGMSGGGSGYKRRSATQSSPSHSARTIASCFNAFVERRSLTKTLVMDASAPIKILGSPFTGNE